MERSGVTIAIPNWNHELLLPRSISSALATMRLFRGEGIAAETLVIDDGSRDGSLQLLRQLEAQHYDEGLRVLARSTNAGLAAARDLALQQARQRYVVFMDADNELLPETMALFRRALIDTGAAAAYGTLLVRESAAGPACGVVSNESFQQRIFQDNYVDAFAMVDRLQLLELLLHGRERDALVGNDLPIEQPVVLLGEERGGERVYLQYGWEDIRHHQRPRPRR